MNYRIRWFIGENEMMALREKERTTREGGLGADNRTFTLHSRHSRQFCELLRSFTAGSFRFVL